MPLANEWLAKTDAKGVASRDGLPSKWVFPSGATLEFGHVQHEANKDNYQGAAYQFVGFDELTHFPKSIYEYIGFSRQRRRMDIADIPIQTYASANPGGIGHLWVKERFIDKREPHVLFMPAKVWDNPGLDAADYELSLNYLDPVLRAQLMHGDWGAFLGAAYTIEAQHIVDPFDPPGWWERFEFMDHGVANPTAWYFTAIDADGNAVVLDEHYAGESIPTEHVPVILAKRAGQPYIFKDVTYPAIEPWYPKWLDGNYNVQEQTPRTFADPAVTHRIGATSKAGLPATIATEYREHSEGQISLIPGNNDRAAGHVRIKELLKLDPNHRFPDWHPLAGQLGSPRLFVSKRCENLIEQLEGAMIEPLDSGKRDAGEVVAAVWEQQYGHAHAALRYGMLTWPDASDAPPPVPDNPYAALLQRYEDRVNNDYDQERLLDV